MNNPILVNIIFVSILVLYGVITYFIGKLSWDYLFNNLTFVNKKVYWVLFWFVAWSYIFFRLLERYLPPSINIALMYIGGYWMAIFFYVALMLLMILLIKFVNSYFNFLPETFKNPQTVALGVVIIIGLLLAYGTWNARTIETTHYDVVINKQVEGLSELNIVMVADIHLDYINNNKRLERLVNAINEQEPDVVFLVGDIIDTHISIFTDQQMDKTMQKIQSTYGVYGVLGNHEYYNIGSIDEVITTLEKGNITMLRDDYVKVNDSFYVVGRDDITVESMEGRPREALASLMNNFDHDLPIILLDHQPLHLDESMENGVDLHLSGHTHRGQIFPNFLITQRMFEVDWGYLEKDGLHAIVTSGAHTWGPPIRINTKSEIKNITVTFE